jgi:very-short-patch-repair endonuclease
MFSRLYLPRLRGEGARAPKSAWGGGGKAASSRMPTPTLMTNRARRLRKSMSEPEVMLWSRLRRRDAGRPIFRRQHPLGRLILDFYCASARLAVEVDGGTHWDDSARERDAARDHWLGRQGVKVLRFPRPKSIAI